MSEAFLSYPDRNDSENGRKYLNLKNIVRRDGASPGNFFKVRYREYTFGLEKLLAALCMRWDDFSMPRNASPQ